VDFDESRVAPNEPTLRLYKVEQRLDARYVPVKRVDQLRLGYESHRFAFKPLAMTSFSDEEFKRAPPPPAVGGDGTGGAPPLARGGRGAPPAANDANFTPNGIDRRRYLERTEQVRRMPVALVLIVDQAHVQDVIRALSNSRLRFQNTQFHYERYRGTISLGMPEMQAGAAPPVPGAVPNGPPRPGAGGERRGGNRPRGVDEDVALQGLEGPGRPGPRGPIPGDPAINPAVDEESASNLVELTVYGLISLYEQFPPKTPAGTPPADGGQPAPAPAAPAAPAAPVPPPPANAPVPPPANAPGAGGLPPPAPAGPSPTPTAPPAGAPPPANTPTPPGS
jgi:hypothetical protein